MQRFNTYQTAPVPSGGSDWQAEINGGGQTEARSVGDARSWQSPEGSEYVTLPGGQMMPMGNMPGMRTDLPENVIQNPLSVEEAHNGSIKAMLARNEGNYVVATFLVGTQGTVSWEGILYDVGNDFITIYQPGRERYIVTDIYALKYIEFYDTRRREQCEAMLKQLLYRQARLIPEGLQYILFRRSLPFRRTQPVQSPQSAAKILHKGKLSPPGSQLHQHPL